MDMNDSLHNLTIVEDFEVFDGRDVLNVVAYALMSTCGPLKIKYKLIITVQLSSPPCMVAV